MLVIPGKTKTHSNDGDLATVIERHVIQPHPTLQPYSRRISVGPPRRVHSRSGCLTGDTNPGGPRHLQYRPRLVGQSSPITRLIPTHPTGADRGQKLIQLQSHRNVSRRLRIGARLAVLLKIRAMDFRPLARSELNSFSWAPRPHPSQTPTSALLFKPTPINILYSPAHGVPA